jgi:hypothetical protein
MTVYLLHFNSKLAGRAALHRQCREPGITATGRELASPVPPSGKVSASACLVLGRKTATLK